MEDLLWEICYIVFKTFRAYDLPKEHIASTYVLHEPFYNYFNGLLTTSFLIRSNKFLTSTKRDQLWKFCNCLLKIKASGIHWVMFASVFSLQIFLIPSSWCLGIRNTFLSSKGWVELKCRKFCLSVVFR